MAYKGEIQRNQKYANSMQGNYIPGKITGYVGTMNTEFAKWTKRTVAIEQKTKLILGEGAIPTIMSLWYLIFARKLNSLRYSFRGTELINLVDIEVTKWVGMGLDRDIVERIRNTVFALAPATP